MNFYLWLKALHVIAVISWMAGMLYLPRLFVYHAEAERGSQLSETLKIMERRLLRIIINPAMILVWLTGLGLGFAGHFFGTGWLDTKVLLVLLMSGMHGFLSKTLREFTQDKNVRPPSFFRKINEVPTLLMIAIVILVVVKPF
jgi:protoporphyrinogen IX oxidase